MGHGGDDAQPELGLGQHQPPKVVAGEPVQPARRHGLRGGWVRLVEEHRFSERLAGAHVADGGDASVAEDLEDLHGALGQQVERVGGVTLQEDGGLGR